MSNKKNLDAYLIEVFKSHVAIADEDYNTAKEIFDFVFTKVKEKMDEQCNYFKNNCKEYFYAGSVSDGIKVSKLDEFDMDIVIRLPMSGKSTVNDIEIVNEKPGFVKLTLTGFNKLQKQQNWEGCNNVLIDWIDEEKYLLQNEIRDWMQSIVKRAMNGLKNCITIENKGKYRITHKHSGPAITLNIKHIDKTKDDETKDFSLDVDLVPVIKFQYPDRWPDGYRKPMTLEPEYWYVVPKPDKSNPNIDLQNRCWRLSFQKFELNMIKKRHHFKITIRLVKKLRDVLNMKAIASYYIKTLFLKKINEEKNNGKYWTNKVSVLFRDMVQMLHDAIKAKNIPYYWNESHNLISGLKETQQKEYVRKLKGVLTSIDGNNVDDVVASLLTDAELTEFKASSFYQRQNPFQEKIKEVVDEYVTEFNNKLDNLCKKMEGMFMENKDLRDEMVKLKSKLTELEKMKSENINEEDLVNVGNDIDVLEFESEEREWDPDDNPKRIKLNDGRIGLAPKREFF